MPVADQLTAPLEFGAVAGAVLAAQRALSMHGYNVPISGTLDRRTEVALYAYQRHSRMTHSHGVLDRETAEALDASTIAHPNGAAIHAPETFKGMVIVANFARPLWLEMALWICDHHAPVESRSIDWSEDPSGDGMQDRRGERVPGSAKFMARALIDPTIIPPAIQPDTPLGFGRTDWGGLRLPDIAVGAIAPMIEDGLDHVVVVAGRDMTGHVMAVGLNQLIGGKGTPTVEPFSYNRFNRGFWWPGTEPKPVSASVGALPVVLETGHFSHV